MQKTLLYSLLIVSLLASFSLQAQDRGRKRHKGEESNTMIDKKRATEIFIEGTKARLLGDFEKAAGLFRQSLDIDPDNDAAMYELSQLYFAQNDFGSASALIEKAIDIDPKNPYYRLLALDIYGKSGRKDDLLKTCLQLVKQYPENVDYKFELASAYLMLGKSDEALKTYNSIEEVLGVTEEVSLQKHRIYLLLNKPDKAVAEIEALIQANPEESARYYSMLAEIYMQQNKPDKAAEYYQKIVDTDPGNPYVHISLSDYYRKKGDKAKSLEELKLGFANPALDVDTKIRVLTTYYTVNEIYNDKKEEVSQLTDILLKAHPKDPKALSLNGDMLLNMERYSEARDVFRKVLASDSSSYSVWESLLQAEVGLLDWNSVSLESARAMDLFPFQPVPYFFNGVALLQLKNPADAVKVLSSGAKLVTSNDKLLIQFYSNLGDAYNEMKQYRQSDEAYEKVLKIDPENSYVLNNYAYYLTLRNEQLDKALQMARKGVEKDSLNPANMDTYGWVLYKMGKYAEAETWVGKAIQSSAKDDADLLEHYGDIKFKLGNEKEALEFWKKAKDAGGKSELLEKKIKEKKLFE